MATTTIHWEWDEAFSKWGFDDGDGPNFTDEVAEYIRGLGYAVECDRWGVHNYIITEVSLATEDDDGLPDRIEYMADVDAGYDDPRQYLPAELVTKLDVEFGD